MTESFLRAGGFRVLATSCAITVVGGCATAQRPSLPEPLRPAAVESGSSLLEAVSVDPASDPGQARGVVLTPPANSKPDPALSAPIQVPSTMPGGGKPISLVLDGVPLTVFIDVVFANELKFPIAVDKSVRERSDLVSFRVAQPTPPKDLYRLAAELLRSYGVAISEMGGSLRFYGQGGGTGNYIATRDPNRVPSGQRVFVTVPLGGMAATVMANQLQAMYPQTTGLAVSTLMESNSLLLAGPSELVREAVRTIAEVDKSGALGSLSIRPQFADVRQLAEELRDVLRAAGYTVRDQANPVGALSFVVVGGSNQLLIFGQSQLALRAAAEWAERLDQPSSVDGGSAGAYVYAPRHTTVQTLLPVISALVTGQSVAAGGARTPAPGGSQTRVSGAAASFDGASSSASQSRTASASAGTGSGVQAVSGAGGQIVADPVRNLLVFQGDPQRWRAIQSVLARLDVPTRQVVIEVTIAEVSLTDELQHGVEWAVRNLRLGNFSGPVNILPNSVPFQGMVWRAVSGDSGVQAVVNLFAKDSRITILSTPRIMVKSGEHASIAVGDEVPVITSQATAADLPVTNGTSSILQQVQYRKTGVLLDVEATVHSSQRVDLKITQEVSNASATSTSKISSPTIQSRRAETALTLADGQSMLLGGLISERFDVQKTKVPLLGDIPVLGALFQNRGRTKDRTELIMLITPYIISNEQEGRDLTNVVRSRFETGNQGLRLPANAVPATPPVLVTPPADGAIATPAIENAPVAPGPAIVVPEPPSAAPTVLNP